MNAGAIVTATTRKPERLQELLAKGVHAAEIEGPGLVPKLDQALAAKFDAVLNLVGNSVLLETLTIVRRGGHLCQAGWLGGLAPIADFNPMVQMASGVHFSLFHSKVLGTPEFPMSDIPLQDVVRQLEQGAWSAAPSRVFAFDDIRAAHELMELGDVSGKLVVLL